MLYTPLPGTPLHQQIERQGKLLPDVDPADIHGQYKFNFRHDFIIAGLSRIRCSRAPFERDYVINGPSLFRICRTGGSSGGEARDLGKSYAAMLWAMESFLRKPNPAVSDAIRTLRSEIEREFGFVAKCYARLGGPAVLWTSRRETVRLERGFRYEPPTFVERKNWVAEPQPA